MSTCCTDILSSTTLHESNDRQSSNSLKKESDIKLYKEEDNVDNVDNDNHKKA